MAKQEFAKKIEEILEGFLGEKGLEIYNVEYKKEGPDWVLRVYLDKLWDEGFLKREGTEGDVTYDSVSIDECEAVAQFLSEKLDEQDIIDRAYNLEVSSPGLDRELIKPKDYERFAGREVELKLYEAFSPEKTLPEETSGSIDERILKELKGEKTIIAKLVCRMESGITISIDDKEITVPIDKISKINLTVVF